MEYFYATLAYFAIGAAIKAVDTMGNDEYHFTRMVLLWPVVLLIGLFSGE